MKEHYATRQRLEVDCYWSDYPVMIPGMPTGFVAGYVDLEFSVEYEITHEGCPPSGPSFNDPGDPGESPEYEIHGIRIKDVVTNEYHPVPKELYDKFYDHVVDYYLDNLLENASAEYESIMANM